MQLRPYYLSMSRFPKLDNPCVYALLSLVIITPGFSHGLTEDRLHNINHDIGQQPDNPKLYLQRGIILEDSEHWNEALSDYKKAFEIDSDYNEALFRQGKTYLEKGDLKKSLTILKRYIAHRPRSPAGHKILARAYADTNRLEKAVHHYDLSIKYDLNPPPQLYLDRMQVLFKTDPIPTEQIASGLMEGINKHGNTIIFSEAIIKLYTVNKNYQLALNWLDKIPESLKNSPYWLNRRADLEYKRGNKNQALRLYAKSIHQLKALPVFRQNTPALAAAQHHAEKEILRIKDQKQAVK
jgi:predicted Zn-dependent protease